MVADLTLTHTELEPLRTFHEQHEIDALLDAAFKARDYRTCSCGRVLDTTDAVCHPCRYNERLGPLYGGSLAGGRPRPACMRCDDLRDQRDACDAACHELAERLAAQTIENSDLAREVVALTAERDAAKRALEAQAAAVRAGKLGAG